VSRGRLAVLLLVIGTLVAPLAAVAVWARNQVLDTDAYVRTVAPLATNAAIRDAVGDRVAEQLAGAGTGPVAQKDARHAVDAVLASEAFARLWTQANRLAHDQVVKVLTGTGRTKVEGDTLVLDLTPVAQEVLSRLHREHPKLFAERAVPAGSLTFELFAAHEVTKAQRAVRALDRLAIFVPIVAFLALLGSVLLATDTRISAARAGLGLAVGMALLIGLLGVGRSQYLDVVGGTEIPRGAAAAFFDDVIRYLRNEARVAVLVGVSIGVACGLAGRRVSPRAAVRTAAVSAACLLIAAWAIPSAAAVAATAIVTAVVVGAAQLLPRATTP